MRWLLKYWKPALATALLLALIAAWQADRRTQYRRGQADKAAEISLALAKAAQTQNENTLTANHLSLPALPCGCLTSRISQLDVSAW